jgi:hypothetical protein
MKEAKGTFAIPSAGVPDSGDPAWVRVAAASSLPAAKAAADFVCTGDHDEKTIQAAIDRCAADGRDLLIFNGLYCIDAFRDWGDGGPLAAIRIPRMLRHFTMRGQQTFQNGRGTIPEDVSVWRNGVVLYVRDSVWATAGTGVPSVLRGECTEVASQNGAGLAIEKVSVFICDTQHPARCVDLRWTDAVEVRDMSLNGFGYRVMNGDSHPWNKFGPLPMPHIDAIGITMTSGSNHPVSRFDNIIAQGFGQAFQAGGEHVICNDCLAAKNLYGWTFGNYEYAHGAFCHPIVLVNCADEQSVHLPLFGTARNIDQDGDTPHRQQSVTMVGCNFERMEYLTIGGKLGDGMREKVPGSWRGRIEYTMMPHETAANTVDCQLWQNDGSGIGFETVNLVHKLGGSSEERRTYAPHLWQRYFDTDLKKLLVCTDPARRLWVDALGNPAP